MYFPDIDSMPKSTYTIQTSGPLGDFFGNLGKSIGGLLKVPGQMVKDIAEGFGKVGKDIKERTQPKPQVIKAPEPQPAPKPAPIRTQEEEKMPSWIWIVAIGGVLLVVLLASK